MLESDLELRAAKDADWEAVAGILIETRTEFMPYAPSAHGDAELRGWVRTELIPGGGVVVAEDQGHVVGVMATAKGAGCSWITQMAVRPERVGRGIGARMLASALAALASPIRLYTFQANTRARRFYERHGFVAIEFTDGQGNEEHCPDVLYEHDRARIRPCNDRPMELRDADPQGAQALLLLREAAVEARGLYPERFDADAPWPTNAPMPARGVYLVGDIDGAPVACGALRPLDAEAVELRRIFVTRAQRRKGLARFLLTSLEQRAVALGFKVVLLETGSKQQAAMALYESAGFHRVAPFGPYSNDPTSVCYEKFLSPRNNADARPQT